MANIPLGTLIAERPAGRRPFNRDERMLLEAATRQAAVALDRARLDARARLAQVDAETNQLRAAMFSSVTHDLRTPLASIKAGVTSLLDEGATHDEGQERDLLTTILEETDRLNRLVGNILDLAKIRAGALISRRVPTAVDEVAEAVVARMRPRLGDVVDRPPAGAGPARHPGGSDAARPGAHEPPRERGASLAGGRDDPHPRDADRTRRPPAGRRRGPGIHVDDREKVFEAFYRGRQSPESPGSGLGLSIARAIVTAHGGRIWVEETMGGGTAMVLDMPIQETGL